MIVLVALDRSHFELELARHRDRHSLGLITADGVGDARRIELDASEPYSDIDSYRPRGYGPQRRWETETMTATLVNGGARVSFEKSEGVGGDLRRSSSSTLDDEEQEKRRWAA